MERHVLEAALAVSRPATPAEVRSQASRWLEGWTRSDEAPTWEAYANLIGLFFFQDQYLAEQNDLMAHARPLRVAAETAPSGTSQSILENDILGAEMLVLTMLHAKIQREYGSSPVLAQQRPDLATRVRDGIGAALTRAAGPADAALTGHLCSCAAAVAVRGAGGIQDLVATCHASLVSATGPVPTSSAAAGLPVESALRTLSCLPEESDLSEATGREVDAELLRCVGAVMDGTARIVMGATGGGGGGQLTASEAALALKVLGNWVQRCQITLSQLNQPSGVGDEAFLTMLVQILSQPHPSSEELLNAASEALSNAVLVPSDAGTPTRQAAVTALLASIPQGGFLIAPFAHAAAHELDESARSLATLGYVIACEEVDVVAQCELPGCPELIELLLRVQSHPRHSVSVAALEAWLALQDIPTAERHPDVAGPLFGRIVDLIIPRISYGIDFTTWEDEGDLDPQEFTEMRRLVGDVLVSAYFLLRVGYVDRVVAAISADPTRWIVTESALFCLISVAREICARVKARAGGSSVAADKEATAQRLMHLVSELCAGGAESAAARHELVLSAVCTFAGSFAPVWNVVCAPEAILELLAYLRDAMRFPGAAGAAAKSSRQIYVWCGGKLVGVAKSGDLQHVQNNPVASCVSATMEAALSASHEHGMKLVAEGSTRLCMQLKEGSLMRQYLCIAVAPILQSLQHALESIRQGSDEAQIEKSLQDLGSCLRVIRESIRFCDEPASSNGAPHPLTDVLNVLWPQLNDIVSTPACRQHDDVLSELLSIHGQLLSVVPDLVSPHFSGLINLVVRAYEESHLPCALDYVTAAIEAFGGNAETIESFSQLLAHLSQCTCIYLTQEKRPNECPEVIKSLFEMAQRYLLFCPGALTSCAEFTTLFDLAVACLDECKGERESTRATLNYLSQLIGWKTLRLSPNVSAALETTSGTIDVCVLRQGETIIKACVGALAGGAPQGLWPSYSDCLFAIIAHVSGTRNGEEDLAHQWMMSALSDDTVLGLNNGRGKMTGETKVAVARILLRLASEGPSSKQKAKMLLGDFGKICQGQATAEVLVAYSLE